ncbi:Lrp/AsnC family transcriptional regulator [Streptomyces sp. NPDC005483]|uniref:Lrp/AsnC family transcriptional regulator n=1 Tax=Streptomyces sp. NPDC005483 TaxID=3154882 RepID=UPI0033BDAFA9
MKPHTRQARDELLLDRLPRTPRVTSVSAHCLLHHFYGGPLGWLRRINALSPDEQAALSPPPVEPATTPAVLDDADEALLAVLSRDGRAPLTELQARTNLPESAVRRRQDRLRSTGVLYLDVQFNHEYLGHDVVAMLWLTVAPASLGDVGRTLASHPEVRFAAATTGQANIRRHPPPRHRRPVHLPQREDRSPGRSPLHRNRTHPARGQATHLRACLLTWNWADAPAVVGVQLISPKGPLRGHKDGSRPTSTAQG